MGRRGLRLIQWLLPVLVAVMAAAQPAQAAAWSSPGGHLQLGGDLRLRLEQDWDSVDAQGLPREDRTRARVRARAGLFFMPNEHLRLGLRLRTGADGSQQSAHITWAQSGGGDRGDADINLDQWYVRGQGKRWSGTAGRMVFPFFHQNEMFWDDDVTPAGVAGTWEVPLAPRQSLRLHGALLTPPDGMTGFHGRLAAGQVVYDRSHGAGGGLTLAAGLFDLSGEEGAVHLRNGNGARDYQVLHLAAQWRTRLAGRPLVLGGDWLSNRQDYSGADGDPFTAAFAEETRGYVAAVRYGQSAAKGDWLLAWFYARVEALAVNASFAQDDWVRWGSTSQTDASDLKGHEWRYAYQLTGSMQIMARFYVVKAITSVQDGNRLRVDWNYRF